MKDDVLVRIGFVSGAHGLDGEIRLRPYNPETSLPVEGMEVVLVSDGMTPTKHTVAGVRRGPRHLLVRLDSIHDRDAAESLKGCEMAVRSSDLPSLDEDEFYYKDVIGLPVVDEDGVAVGTVDDVIRTGTDVLVVVGRGVETMIPVVDVFVLELGPDRVVVTRAALEPAV